MINEGDDPTVQCEMSVRQYKFMIEVGGPRIIFIDYNVRALTSCLS
jgi:hypothetical protein